MASAPSYGLVINFLAGLKVIIDITTLAQVRPSRNASRAANYDVEDDGPKTDVSQLTFSRGAVYLNPFAIVEVTLVVRVVRDFSDQVVPLLLISAFYLAKA